VVTSPEPFTNVMGNIAEIFQATEEDPWTADSVSEMLF
jgi:hypothetical protein